MEGGAQRGWWAEGHCEGTQEKMAAPELGCLTLLVPSALMESPFSCMTSGWAGLPM